MPFSTKAFEFRVPKATIPKDSIRVITRPDETPVPKVLAFADFINDFNPTNNTSTSDTHRHTLDVQADQRFPLMFMLQFAVSIYANLDPKQHPTLTPMSILAYLLTLYHAFHLASDKMYRSSPSRHASHFLQDSDRRQYYHELLSLIIPSPLESFLRLMQAASDPRRPDIINVPSYAGFSFNHDLGRFFPMSFALLGHNQLAVTRSNSDPNHVLNHWLRLTISTSAANTPLLTVGQLLGYIPHATAPTMLDSWLSSSVLSVMTPSTMRTISQRYVYSPVTLDPIDFSELSNLSIGYDGSVNTGYDINDINPYILGLSADLDNLAAIRKFTRTIGEIIEDANLGSNSLGKILEESSSANILGHCYIGPTLPTHHSVPQTTITKPTSPMNQIAVDLSNPRTHARTINFLTARTFVHGQNLNRPQHFPLLNAAQIAACAAAQPAVPSAADFAMMNRLLILNVRHDSTNVRSPDNYVRFALNQHYQPEIRILLPFDSNPSEAAYPQICGLLIESAELASFSVSVPDIRRALIDENSEFLSSAIPLSKIHQMNDLALSVIDRTVPEPLEESTTLQLYNSGLNRSGRIVYDADTTLQGANYVPFGTTQVDNIFATDLSSNIASYTHKPEQRTAVPALASIPDEFIYLWSPYRYVHTKRTANHMDSILMLANLRTFYGTATPMMSAPHPSIRFPSH